MIEFDRVSKAYAAGSPVVDDLTLTMATGEITVLVGPSGCGKTTSLRMINRMVEPTSGAIRIDGTDVSTIDPPQLRRGIGYVIQHAGLFPHRTVLDNVGTVLRLTGWSKAKSRERSLDLLERVGLEAELADRYPAQLSGGQQQRVGVARALAADPPIMLMDEPFSAVDPVVRAQLQDEFLRLQDELGTTIVFVTHDIDEAIKLGDQVAVLRVGGRLAQAGPPAEILARPADDFVAAFVGKDRGYRGLAFRPATGLILDQPTTVTLGGIPDGSGWTLVLDDERRPLGWVHGAPGDDGGTPVDREHVLPGGTVAERGGSLRSVLDAALSSPAGVGVVVDGDGRLAGTISAAEVLAAGDAA